MTNEDILRDWLHVLLIEQDFRAVEDGFAPPAPDSQLTDDEPQMRPNDYETVIGALCRNFRPEKLALRHVVSNGPKISATAVIDGTRIDTEEPIVLTVTLYRKIEGGKFVEYSSTPDFLGFFKAMGQMPEDTIQTLLMGGRLKEVFI